MEGQLRRSSRERGLSANPSNGATADVIISPASSAVPDGPPEESGGSQPAGSATVASGNENGAAEMESSANVKPKPSLENSAKERPETKDVEESDVAQGNEELEERSSPSAQEVDPSGCSQHEPQEAGDQSPRPGQSSVPAGSLKEMAKKLDDGSHSSRGSKEVLTRVLDGILRLVVQNIDKDKLQEADSESPSPGQSSVPAGSLTEMAEKLYDGSHGPKERLTRLVCRVLEETSEHERHASLQDQEIKYGILLELMKLLATFDPVLGEHMAKANALSPTYVSHQIVNGLTKMASSQVRKKILDEVKEAKYYAVLLDAILVPPSRERKSQVLRYVAFEEGEVVIKEAFVDFIDFEGHASKPSSTQYVLEKLVKDGLEIADCRAQASDVLSTMCELHKAIDILGADAKLRFEQLGNLAAKFACLHPKKLLNSVEDEKLRNDLDNLALFYRGDVEPGATIMKEVEGLRLVPGSIEDLKNESYSGLLEWILRRKLEEAFPNLTTLLKICLTVCISAATCERNSQKMELIQRHGRSFLDRECSSALAILSVEKDAVEKLDFDECLKSLAVFTAREIFPELLFYRYVYSQLI